jgi:ABC-2 type transport system ATP-binding protein
MIETNDLSKQFGDFWAVDGLTLAVAPGQILALLGQNGAGKTTTVRMLTALLSPSRGWARLGGYDVVRQPKDVRAAVGVLTEQHGLYMRMTAVEYLGFFANVYGLAGNRRRDRTRQLLEYFGLAQEAHRRIGEFSKGMRQKLALARALLHDPTVLLLDEPTSAMDPESARLVRDEIARLKSAQRTVVFCTHNLSEAEALADFVVIIYRGRILTQGSIPDLKQRILGPPEYIVTFSRDWQPESLELPVGVRLVSRTPSTLRLRVEAPAQTNPEILQALMARSAPLLSLHEAAQTLEQVYLQAMASMREGLRVD